MRNLNTTEIQTISGGSVAGVLGFMGLLGGAYAAINLLNPHANTLGRTFRNLGLSHSNAARACIFAGSTAAIVGGYALSYVGHAIGAWLTDKN